MLVYILLNISYILNIKLLSDINDINALLITLLLVHIFNSLITAPERDVAKSPSTPIFQREWDAVSVRNSPNQETPTSLHKVNY